MNFNTKKRNVIKTSKDPAIIHELILKNCEKLLLAVNLAFKSKVNEIEQKKLDYSNQNYLFTLKKNSLGSNNVINNSFISFVDKNGVTTEISISEEELLILRLAMFHNNNVVNLLSKTDLIKILISKGLIYLSDCGLYLVLNKIAEVIFKTEQTSGCIAIDEELSSEFANHEITKNIVNVSWGNL